MKVTPCGQYMLCKRYIKPKKEGALILTNEEKYNHWGVVEQDGLYSKNIILQLKPYSQVPVDGSEDLFLVKEEDVIAVIEV